ncbi:MAG: toprim domain-containing protein [Bacillaceae bacterium]|nr:toprim domain-containing protein [Bacillaceae bacterium]
MSKKHLDEADAIVIATDSDREGEANRSFGY